MQVQHDGIDDRADGRLGDHEAAARAAPRPGHLLVLHQAHGLTEHGPADLVALEKVGLGAEDLAHRPAEGHHVFDDEVRHLGCPLGVRVGTRTRHVAGDCRGRHQRILPGRNLPETLLTSAFDKRVVRKGARTATGRVQ